MGVTPQEFWHGWSFADYQRRVYYHTRRLNDEYKTQWEVARHISFINYKIGGGKIGTASAFYPFPWDAKSSDGRRRPTAEEIKKMTEGHAKFFEKLKQQDAAGRN